MHGVQPGRERPAGQTSGTEQRPPHEVTRPVTVLDLGTEAEALRREPAWQSGDRNAKTFVKESDLRVVLTVVKQGAHVTEHRAPGTAVIQTLSGHIQLRLGGQMVDLPAGRQVVLAPDLSHEVDALEESAFTVTIAWPSGARDDESRG